MLRLNSGSVCGSIFYMVTHILSGDNQSLQRSIVTITEFLKNYLRLELHPKKIILRKLHWGIDFLGYIVLPHYILPRTKTRKRIFKRLEANRSNDSYHLNQSVQSYLDYLSHANAYFISQKLRNLLWIETFN